MSTYKITDEHNDVITGVESIEEAIDYAKEYDADVFDELTGECVWINPDATWA